MSDPIINAIEPSKVSGDVPPVIEGYIVQEKLGQGGMSTVWKAQQVSLCRDVVIKVLSTNLSRGVEDIKQFMFEAQVAASLKHQGIVQVYDFGQCKTDARYYFVMEYISGYSVGDWIRRKNQIADADALVIAQSVSEALRYAWNKSRIVHCDIKPDNIMVDGDGSIKLTDLGLAHAVGNIHTITNQAGDILVMGTPNYMAPEQVRGDASIDFRTDIYALGASLYHMVSGYLPFQEADGVAAMELQINYYMQDPRKINPAVGAGTTRLIEKMMMKKPERRHKDWTEVIEDIYLVQMGTMPVGDEPEPGESTVSVNRTREQKKPDTVTRILKASKAAAQPANMKVKVLTATKGTASPKPKILAAKPSKAAPAPAPEQASPPAPAGQVAPAVPALSSDAETIPTWIYVVAHIRRIIRGFLASLRMLLSITLILFISYVMYMRVAQDTDVLAPWRDEAAAYLEPVKKQWDAISAKLFPAKPRSRPRKQETEQESTEESGTETVDVADEVDVVKELPEITKQADNTPQPKTTEVASLANTSTTVDIEQTEAFKSILKLYENKKPNVKDSVTLKLKDQDEPITGVIERFTQNGVMLKVTAGLVEYPFAVMDEKTRINFFPLENARLMYRRKYGKGLAAPAQN